LTGLVLYLQVRFRISIELFGDRLGVTFSQVDGDILLVIGSFEQSIKDDFLFVPFSLGTMDILLLDFGVLNGHLKVRWEVYCPQLEEVDGAVTFILEFLSSIITLSNSCCIWSLISCLLVKKAPALNLVATCVSTSMATRSKM
jgi:hypothetical protein